MRLRAWLWLALSSFSAGLLCAETRPHYGGVLSVDLSPAFPQLDPAEMPAAIWPLVGQTLVRINARGDPEPWLAAAWQREANGRRWRISLRNKVLFHDGEPLNAGAAAAILLEPLKKSAGEVTITAGGSTMLIQSENPLPNLLAELASPGTAIVRKSETGQLVGTGPFRITGWEPGRRLTLAAFQDYWGGRPYLDSIVITLGSTRTTGDLFDVPLASPRRIVPETVRIWQSAPQELLAILADNAAPAAMDALAHAIDRAPVVNVLAQHKGSAAFGLLPNWLTGYEFLFQTAPDPARARQLAGAVKAGPLTLGYPPNDSFARAVAERVALNARDAGMVLQPSTNGNAALRLVRWPLESRDAAVDLIRIARALGLANRANAADDTEPETLFQTERALLESNRVIPLAHLDSVYGVAPRVHWKDHAGSNALIPHLEDCWVDP